ncbi:hypothetical protein [Desulfosporosinus hippei]|uniref:hypothetical protein n=1 Tax=Desulfosporosinus hippei TaxID=569859 RepID=UPI001A9A6087|nr:hypothetical protein [Desulfosporosinus hippei]
MAFKPLSMVYQLNGVAKQHFAVLFLNKVMLGLRFAHASCWKFPSSYRLPIFGGLPKDRVEY